MSIRILLLVMFVLTHGVANAADDDRPIDFAHDVLPILKQHCAACHSNGTYKGNFSLDNRDALLVTGAVRPGDISSELIQRIISDDPESRMPFQKPALSDQDIVVLTAWVKQGLMWQEGFSFRPTSSQVPLQLQPVELPAIGRSGAHPIDRIVDQYWQQRELPFPNPASDRQFVRRVYLDVVGELPTADQVQRFAEDTSDDRRARLVKELLTDDLAYAEHWLSFWNDLLRNDYAGTGFIDGGRKQITDWLYASLLENKPYDQFVRELINPKSESEGFIKGIKWRGRVNASQVRELQFAQNISQVFLGINMKCASCHDSFIDDWKLSDAYGLAAIIADQELEIHRCDKPTGELATAAFVYPELGTIDADASRDERLQQLSLLMTKPENGRFSRTIVNRIWQRLMGRGIVHPVDVMSNEAWSSELLDFLAMQLVESEYDLKEIIGLIATSNVYAARSTSWDPADDGEPFVFTGPLVKRLSAEQFLDSVWRITRSAPDKAAFQTADRAHRPVRASLVVSDILMRSLGRPNREQVVTTRPESLTTLQALDLSNGEQMSNMLNEGAQKLIQDFADRPADELVASTYLSALGRRPTDDEQQVALQILGAPIEAESVSDYLWVLLMLPEFQLIR